MPKKSGNLGQNFLRVREENKMLYLSVLGFFILAVIKVIQQDANGFFMFSVLAGIFLISATIESIYDKWTQKKALEYKTLSEFFEKLSNDLEEKQKEQEKKM